MRIYIASSWKNAKMVLDIAYYLRGKGHQVDAFVDSYNGRYVFHWKEIFTDKNKFNARSFLRYKQAKKAFQEDKKWLDWCEVCVLLLPAGNSAHLEAGYIKGQKKKLIIYRPTGFPKGEFDVMYGLGDLMTERIESILKFLKESK